MKITLNTILLDVYGKEISDPADKIPLTVGKAAVAALCAGGPDEKITGAEKFKRWQLAQKIAGVLEAELTVEEVALIKKVSGEVWGIVVVGPLWLALETTN
jgi:hypothetical protein